MEGLIDISFVDFKIMPWNDLRHPGYLSYTWAKSIVIFTQKV